MKHKTILLIGAFIILFLLVNQVHAWDWGRPEDWNLTFSVPAIKVRQGEEMKIFNGLGAGIHMKNVFSRKEDTFLNAISFSPMVFMSTLSTSSSGSATDDKSDYVISIGLLLNILGKEKHNLQVGYGYDVLSGEDSEAFKERAKGYWMFTLGTSFK